jgi:hypothetical protein
VRGLCEFSWEDTLPSFPDIHSLFAQTWGRRDRTKMLLLQTIFVFIVAVVAASPSRRSFPKYDPRPYSNLARRAVTNGTNNALVVDLGYSLYRGTRNETARIDTWRGYDYIACLSALQSLTASQNSLRSRHGSISMASPTSTVDEPLWHHRCVRVCSDMSTGAERSVSDGYCR